MKITVESIHKLEGQISVPDLPPLNSINLETGRESKALYQRSDICVVLAVSVIGEAVVN